MRKISPRSERYRKKISGKVEYGHVDGLNLGENLTIEASEINRQGFTRMSDMFTQVTELSSCLT